MDLRSARAVRWIALFVVAAFVTLAARTLPTREWVAHVTDVVAAWGPLGPLVFGALFVVAMLLFVPSAPLTVAAGFVFGFGTGLVTVSLAQTAAAAIAFLLGRHVAHERVLRTVRRHPRLERLEEAVSERGWKFVALVRLAPLVPYGMSNYAFGTTSIPFSTYLVATWLALLPGIALHVYVGFLGRYGLSRAWEEATDDPREQVLFAAGLVAAASAAVVLARLTRRVLREDDGPPQATTRATPTSAL